MPLAAVPGGPKLLGFYLNGTNFATYTFPSDVAYADSSLNDVRIDLRGDGWAYITDSSSQRPGIVVLNLATGVSWRHLDLHPSVSVDQAFLPVYNGGANDITYLCRPPLTLSHVQFRNTCTQSQVRTP